VSCRIESTGRSERPVLSSSFEINLPTIGLPAQHRLSWRDSLFSRHTRSRKKNKKKRNEKGVKKMKKKKKKKCYTAVG
jgi:hypothetical protein